jgi:hypothetical protein
MNGLHAPDGKIISPEAALIWSDADLAAAGKRLKFNVETF